MRKRIDRIAILVLVAGFLIFPSIVGRVTAAGPWYVATTGNDSNSCLSPASPCQTIQAAINKASNGDTINVAAGTYAEEVNIRRREDLRVEGAPGAKIVPPAVPLQGVLVAVGDSRGIQLRGLTLSGDLSGEEAGIRIGASTGIGILECTVENMGGGGISAAGHSDVGIRGGTVQGNQFHGIRVDAPAKVTLIGNDTPAPPKVQDNLFAGVIVNGGDFFLRSSTIIQNNQIGVLAEAGRVASCCDEGEHQFLNNITGISMRGGHLELRGPALIKGNTSVGIQLVGTSGSFSRFGELTHRVIVRENGPFGIVLIGSHLDIVRSDVIFNGGRGVLLRDNSSARLFDVLISNNGDVGIRVEGLSSAQVLGSVVMENNQGFDFSCTPNSNAWGDRSGVRRMFCPGFDRSPDPVPGGPNKP
jgi:hypothetical protein